MKQIFSLTIFLFLTSFLLAQSWEDLSTLQQREVAKIWQKKIPATKVINRDKTVLTGQIIYQTDSGIVLRTNPQYLPYTDSSVQFVPFNDIHILEIKQPGQVKENLLGGALIGGLLTSSTTLSLNTNRHGSVRAATFIGGALMGMIISLFKTSKDHKDYQLYFDENPHFKQFHSPQIKKGALYSRNYLPNKNLIPKDSILTGYELPYELDKLKARHKGLKLQVSIASGQTDVWGRESISPKTPETTSPLLDIWTETHGGSLKRTPSFYEIRALYKLTPWLKVGIQTNKIQNEINRFDSQSTLENLHFHGEKSLKHSQSWGIVAEFTPIPTKFLMLRRWDVNFGGGVFRQGMEIADQYELSYFFPPDFGKSSIEKTGEYTYWGALAYGGISFHLNPYVSLQTKVGQFYAPNYEAEGFTISHDLLRNDIEIQPSTYKLSWGYYSFGINFHL